MYGDLILKNNIDSLNIGTVQLKGRGTLLKEIIVRQKGSVRIKGDTTIYLADSFKVDDNANVEDLLKQLPGISVDANGAIQAQGEQVQKVLVDGEEFFGDDPTVATRNLNAKILDKVEVFDDKSEQAKFTGFDDGQKEKTINLKLKDDKNKGLFGKVEAGSNLGQIWNNNAMANAFKNKRKLSVYAINSSNGKNGLNWDERNNFAGSGNGMMTEDGDYVSYYGGDDDDDSWRASSTDGRPKANNIGIHYSNKWNDGKWHLTSNLNNKNTYNNISELSKAVQYIGDANITTSTNKTNFIAKNRYIADARMEVKLDSSSTMVISVNGNNTRSTTNSIITTDNARNGATASTSDRNNQSESTSERYGAEITYQKKLKKKGRTISAKIGGNNKTNNSNGKLIGNNILNTVVNNLDQVKIGTSTTKEGNGKITYTEPLIKDILLAEASYSYDQGSDNANRGTFIKGPTSNYETKIDSLSNHFVSDVNTHRPGLKFNYNKKKLRLGIGTVLSYAIFKQKDLIRNRLYDYDRVQIAPQASLGYKFNSFSNLSISYNGYTNQPSIMQLQDIIDNTDPLNITIGNPNLKQGFSQSMNMNYWNYKAVTDRNYWLGFWMNNRINTVQGTQKFDAINGRTINSYTNVNGYFTLSTWGGYSARIGNSKFKYSLNTNTQHSRMPAVVNDVKAIGISNDLGFSADLRYSMPKKFEVFVSSGISNNHFKNASLGQKNSYITTEQEFNGTYYFSKRCLLQSDIKYSWQQNNLPFTTSFSRALWNAHVAYRFLKQKNLEAKLSVFDILNQNNGYTRESFANNLNERQFNTIKRYGMLSLIYNFSFGPMNRMKDLVGNDDE
jgi:hypothetical protein